MWKKSLARIRSKRPRFRSGNPRRIRSILQGMERLEDRSLLAAVSWTGLGGNTNWSNGANWSTLRIHRRHWTT